MDTVGEVLLLAALVGLVHATLQPHTSLRRSATNQINSKAAAVVDDGEDPLPQGPGSQGAAEPSGNAGKYFMYQHEPHHDLYEFGYHRGNDHHFAERYEEARPHHGHFHTKARWGDKHGGYGEHYWDYNHGDHHGDDVEEPSGEEDEEDAEGDGSSPKSKQQPGKTEGGVHARKKQKDTEAAGTSTSDFRLTYDVVTGFLLNEATGRRYRLTPIN